MHTLQMTRSILLLFVALVMLTTSATSFGQISVSITVGPPALPVYEQPVCPGDGYIWIPGYWAYADDGYYWVPGTWVEPPEVGLLWTPGYWSWNGVEFVFNEGYWGPQVGFYGGISYGFGYFGRGFEGGRWDNGHFFYNRSVTNVDVAIIHNVYNTTVVKNTNVRVSYNGGNGGINARPTPAEEAIVHERHVPPVAAQKQHVQAARVNPELRAAANHGKPPIAATPKPGAFNDRAFIPAKDAGARYSGAADPPHANDRATRPENNVARGAAAVHPNDLPSTEHPAPTNTGNPKQDKKYQQEQEKLNAKQEQERQKLQQTQEKDHQRLADQKVDDAKRQQLEQQHQQQTQQLQQKHAEQQQQLQEKHQGANRNQSKLPKDKT